MSSYSEVRRVRQLQSEAVGHDVRKLIAEINKRRPEVLDRIINPGAEAIRKEAPPAVESPSK